MLRRSPQKKMVARLFGEVDGKEINETKSIIHIQFVNLKRVHQCLNVSVYKL